VIGGGSFHFTKENTSINISANSLLTKVKSFLKIFHNFYYLGSKTDINITRNKSMERAVYELINIRTMTA
jgi:hypothetical protein